MVRNGPSVQATCPAKESPVPAVDIKKERKELYNPSSRQVTEVDVPPLPFLMVDGSGDPNTSEEYRQAVDVLYSVSYALKFMVKKQHPQQDYTVAPLEGLWWTGDEQLDFRDKTKWLWTMMISQPSFITVEIVDMAKQEAAKKKDLPALNNLRFATFAEGRAAQILYVGPFADEGPTIERIHAHIHAQGHALTGKHHEIYLSDPRRTAPEKLKTVIRQPFV